MLFVADVDDHRELAELHRVGADWITVDDPRNYPAKINAGYRETSEPLVFLAADDLSFHPGWLTAAQKVLSDTVDVVGTNDLYNPRVVAGAHSTHTLVRRSYVERFGVVDEPGVVLHEGYPHEYCDDELVQTARARGRYGHAHDSIVEHLHPYAGKAPHDAVYELGQSRRREARTIFRRRRRLWRDLSPSSSGPSDPTTG